MECSIGVDGKRVIGLVEGGQAADFEDAVEAGSRTLKDPSVGRIRSMVNSFTNERLMEHELDECPLTIKELKLINESFVNILTGMYHGRIEYPDQEKKIFKKSSKKAVEA